MNGFGPTDVEIRVLGCLIEKQRATPDHYPLTLNSLRSACNQSTNRDPVVDYDEATIREALGRLGRRRWIRSASGHTSRVAKYRHLLEEALKLSGEQMSLLAVMMLRGPQTPGELKLRTERLHPFADLDEVLLELEGLIERDLVQRLERRPGQKEVRYRHLLQDDDVEDEPAGEEGAAAGSAPQPAAYAQDAAPGHGVPTDQPAEASATESAPSPASVASAETSRRDRDRIDRLETEVAELRHEVQALRDRLSDVLAR